MDKVCRCGCGRALPPQSGPGRPRQFVPEHSPEKRQRDRRVRLASVPTSPTAPVDRPEAPSEPALVTATRAELEAVGKAGTSEGLIVLTLAGQIAAGGGTAQGLASLVRQFHASKELALADAQPEADVLDGIFGAEAG